MMDSTSIITQVNRDEETLDIPPYSGDKGIQSVIKKPRNRNIFSSFFCCFGAHANAAHSASNGGPCTSNGGANTPALSSCPAEESDGNKNKCLLAPVGHQDMHKKCIVIDLDETLVHSSFKPVSNPDFIVPVEIDGTIHQVYVLKRPYVDEFLKRMGELFECVLFTASLAKYADPVSDLLDKYGTFNCRLFRDSCVFHRGNYVKDLSKLGRDIEKVIIVDNSPASYSFHPDNAVPVASWFDDMSDRELLDLIPFLENINNVDNVVEYMQNLNRNPLRQNMQNGNVAT